jgi:hypothetical protein
VCAATTHFFGNWLLIDPALGRARAWLPCTDLQAGALHTFELFMRVPAADYVAFPGTLVSMQASGAQSYTCWFITAVSGRPPP